MGDLSEYEKAQAKYYGNLRIKTLPVLSWDFNYRFSSNIKMVAEDLKKLTALASFNNWNTDFNFAERLKEETIIVTDRELKIVFSSENILEMSGYLPSEVIGQSPKMFQGPTTDRNTSTEIRYAIDNHLPFNKRITNYKKNGKLYRCDIEAYPIFNLKKEFTHFIAFEKAA